MPRLLILWTRPYHLSRHEADAWIRGEIAALERAPGVARARLAELAPAAADQPAGWDWLLELDLTGADCLRRGPCAEWVADLRLLGMRPVVLRVADDASGEAKA